MKARPEFDELESAAGCLFMAWIGMADRDESFPADCYDGIDLDDNSSLREMLRKDIVPVLPKEMQREDVLRAIEFAEYAKDHPTDVDIERIFDTYLITVGPPKDKEHFFRVVYEECILNNPNLVGYARDK